MRKFLRKQWVGLLFFLLGLNFLFYGIHRQEHKTVVQKSSLICLECIGIG